MSFNYVHELHFFKPELTILVRVTRTAFYYLLFRYKLGFAFDSER